MHKIRNQFSTIQQVIDQYLNQNRESLISQESPISFQDILEKKQTDFGEFQLKFSKHASMRMENRNINLSPEQKQRLENGAEKAKEKGIRESLVLMDSLAFIVNIPNRTVVTAMEQGDTTEQIYTNIDGAVII